MCTVDLDSRVTVSPFQEKVALTQFCTMTCGVVVMEVKSTIYLGSYIVHAKYSRKIHFSLDFALC